MNAIALFSLLFAGAVDKKLDVTWVDVEGGGGTLIVTPAGEAILIDTGNPGGRDPERLHKAATEAGLTKIDHVIVTHLHADHFGGLAELAVKIPIGTLYENGIDTAPDKEKTDARLGPYKAVKVDRRVTVKPGDQVPLKQAAGTPPIKLTVLAARQQFGDRKGKPNKALCAKVTPKDPDRSDNANSIVSLIEFGSFRFFDGGDLTWNTEAELVCPADRVGLVDVYQVNHHGLDVSNNPVLIHTLRPSVAVFNNGPKKGGKPAVHAALKASPGLQAVYQVHRNVVDPDNTGEAMIANKDEACAGAPMKMSVDPKGASYTMMVPSTGHSKTYKTKKK